MSFFHNAHNVDIHGHSISFIGTQIMHSQAVDEGLKILYQHAAPGALHNSGERFDPPKVHPGTRVALQEAIMKWLDDPDSEAAMWMNGAMGAGKSAIAQAIAEICFQQGRLLSSFFFARGSAERNNHKRLIATLAYQMSLQAPETRPHLSAAILDDPLIFQSSLQSQIDRLIIGPLLRVHTGPEPRLIIIDGLDECENGEAEAQALIVDAFVSSITIMRQNCPTPYKILIASRPETIIKDAFGSPNLSPSTRQLSLNELWGPDADIRRFLVDSFAELRRTRRYLPADWPPLADINRLVRNSSSQFIYASVVMKFLRSPRTHPVQSLKVILGLLEDSKTRPYAELDALYAHILSKVDDIDIVLRILCVHLSLVYSGVTTSDIEAILQLQERTVHIALNDLVSVIHLDESIDSDNNSSEDASDDGNASDNDDASDNGDASDDGDASGDLASDEDAKFDDDAPSDTDVSRTVKIKFLHSSLTEYLWNQARSGDYYVMNARICAEIANCCLKSLIVIEHDEHMLAYHLTLLPKLANYAGAEAQMAICSAISNVNFLTTLQDIHRLYTVPSDLSEDTAVNLDFACGLVTQWVCKMHTEYSTSSNMPDILSKTVEQIYAWILDQFKEFPFSGFDRVDGVDLWIFASFFHSHSLYNGQLSMFLGKDMAVLSELITYKKSVHFSWNFMCCISKEVLKNSKLLGKYAMTEDRYLDAGIRFAEGLLDFHLKHDRAEFHNIFRFLDNEEAFSYFLEDLQPDEGLCTTLERTLTDDIPRGFDIRRTAELSDTTRRVYAYFWRNNEFSADCDHPVRIMAKAIADYIEKTREMLCDKCKAKFGILGKRKLSLDVYSTPEYAEKRARGEVHASSSNETQLCYPAREPTGDQNDIELNMATPGGDDSLDTSHTHNDIFPNFPDAHGLEYGGAPTDGGWLQGNVEWLADDWNMTTATPGDGSFNTLHNHGNFIPNLPDAHNSEYRGAPMDGDWLQGNAEWLNHDWNSADWSTYQ